MPIVCLELSPVEERAEHHRSRSTIIKPALPKSASATALSLLIPPPGIHTISTYTSPPFLALMLLVANLANTIWCKKNGKWQKPWHMGTGKRVNSCTSRQNVCQCLVVQTSMANISKKPNTSLTRIAYMLLMKVASALKGLSAITNDLFRPRGIYISSSINRGIQLLICCTSVQQRLNPSMLRMP